MFSFWKSIAVKNKVLFSTEMSRILTVFDFDHTVVNENSDVVLAKLLSSDVREQIKHLRPSWTEYMGGVFRLLPEHGFLRDHVIKTCQDLDPTEGMLELIHYLRDIESDIVILSDANSEIISAWLEKNLPGLKATVYTNPAVWEGDVLKVEPLQHQTACANCPSNLCKGTVLSEYLEQRSYDIIAYIGDGKNDFCPSSSLSRPSDLVFPREGFALEKILSDKPITASVTVWKSACDIKNRIKTEFKD